MTTSNTSDTANISVIIPAYNACKTIETCLRSVYGSSCRVSEVIVVDDCSIDTTREIARKFDCVLIEAPARKYQAVARNLGAERACGELLLFVDSDIELKTESIEHAVRTYRRLNAAVIGTFDWFSPHADFLSQHKNLHMVFTQASTHPWIKWTNTSFLLVAKSTFFKVNGFNEDLKEAICEDIDFGIRLINGGQAIYIDHELKVIHHRFVSLRNFIQMEYKRAEAITRLYLENAAAGFRVEWPIVFSFKVTPALLVVIWCSLVLSLLDINRYQSSIVLLSTTFLAFVVNGRFLLFILSKKSLAFTICSFFTLLFDITINTIASIKEIIRFAALKKTKAKSLRSPC